MAKFLIDTDILVDLFHDQEYAKQLIPSITNKGSVYISTITIAELRAGFTNEQADFLLPKLYSIATVLDLDRRIAELGGKLRYEYRRLLPDMLIAATVILEKCKLVTRNKKDFPMKEIHFYPIE